MKRKKTGDAAAYAGADAGAMLKVNSEVKDTTNVVSKKTGKKAKRIDHEFKTDRSLPEDYREFAINEGIKNPEREWEQFYDYWIAISGQRACKLDWLATWRSWVRKNIEWRNDRSAYSNKQQSSGDASIEGALMAIDGFGN